MRIKKTKWLFLGLALVMIVSMFASFTGANGTCPEPPEGAKEVTLYAGQHIDVGNVYVWNDGDGQVQFCL